MKRQTTICCLLTALCLLAGTPVSAEGYGQGKLRDAQNCPVDAAAFTEQYAELGACALSQDKTRIILTFDQGYENGFTGQILDTLRDKNVTAVFFLTGDYAKKEPELVRRMIREGHVLGNHGMTHGALPEMNDAEIETEIMSLHRYVQDNYQYDMQYFRPPRGEYDMLSLAKVQSLGYKTVFWSAAYVDWKTDDQPDPTEALSVLTDAAHGGAVYLLHSVSSTNAAILGDLIDALREKGFTV